MLKEDTLVLLNLSIFFSTIFLVKDKGKKKKQPPTFSSQNRLFLTSTGDLMILLNSKKINIFSSKDKINKNISKCVKQLEFEISEYENTLNYGYLSCSDCHSDKLIGYGTYERNVVIAGFSFKINIKRVFCKNCGRTHAVIPSFLKPYFQFESSFIDFVILLVVSRGKKSKTIEMIFNLSRQLLTKWKLRFKEHKTRLLAYKNLELKELLCELFYDDFQQNYFFKNRLVFFTKITNITFS